MAKPIDIAGLGPLRKAVFNPDTKKWDVTITPPKWSGFAGTTISLTNDQYKKYLSWKSGKGYIQDVFPELTAAQREILISGINNDEWMDKIAAKGEEGDV